MLRNQNRFWLLAAACALVYEIGHVALLKTASYPALWLYALGAYFFYLGVGIIGARRFKRYVAVLGGTLAGLVVGTSGILLRIAVGAGAELQVTRPLTEALVGTFCALVGAWLARSISRVPTRG